MVTPLIFRMVVNPWAFMTSWEGMSLVDHHLDNFITLSRPGSDECTNNFCHILKMEVEKLEGLMTKPFFLGVE